MRYASFRDISMRRVAGLVFLVLLWLMFAIWQRAEHVHQCKLIHETLSSQGEALSSAVRSGILSHRWFGPFVQQQLPGTLETLARSTNVLAIAVVVNNETDRPFYAGEIDQVAFDLAAGEHVRGDTLQVVDMFTMQNDLPPMHTGYPGRPPLADDDLSGPIDRFTTIVVLDRSRTIAQALLEARNRLMMFALGTLLLVSAGAVFRITVRLAESEGTAQLLTAETRHLRELGQAAAGLAHETRNPLGLIRGWTQRLVDAGLPTADQREQAEAVLEECDRVTARINQFLAFARQSDVKLEHVVVRDLVDELQLLLQSDLDAKSLQLTQVGCESGQAIYADRDQFRQVLFNLLQNAIAFAPQRSTIKLSLIKTHGDRFRIEVADQGPGAPEDIIDSLFEPYVTRRPGGTGLGLSIVRRVAVAHHWEVGYDLGTGGGSVFWIDEIRSA